MLTKSTTTNTKLDKIHKNNKQQFTNFVQQATEKALTAATVTRTPNKKNITTKKTKNKKHNNKLNLKTAIRFGESEILNVLVIDYVHK